MGILQNLMRAPAPGGRGEKFGMAMGNMAPLLFAMAKGLGEGKSASTYAPSGLAAMMLQQQTEADRKMRQEDRDYSRSQDSRMWDWRESGRAREDAELAEESRLRRDANSGLAQLLGGGSQYDAMAATGGPTNTAARMSALAPQIEQTAAAIGMSPVDLATIISYETGGTFDPAQAGPTTQWGQHRGLIQFGEPQARQYGVDWNDPVNSQLGADGAVARYFRENGWQPGMGMKDAYSIVNAGAPGRYNATDANNGGAPGTVAEKVDTQMAGHRRRAEAMFPQQQARISPQRAAEILTNPYATDAAKQMVLAQFMPQEPEKPQIIEGADGYKYWVVPGQPPQRVLPDITAPDTGWRDLTPEEIARRKLDPDKQWQIGLDGANRGKISDVGGSLVSIAGDESELDKTLGKQTGETWAGYLKAGNQAAATLGDFEIMEQLLAQAPQGPISGALAQRFPQFSTPAAALNSMVKRIAPTFRVEGSGHTSDIEYAGMLQSLPQLQNYPEANAIILETMRAKSMIDAARAEIVSMYQTDQIDQREAHRRMAQLAKESIITPKMQELLDMLGESIGLSDDDRAYIEGK